jgi:hypothetical protein
MPGNDHTREGEMKTPPADERRRAFDLRCRGKRGEYLRLDDTRFLERLVREYPEWYTSTYADIVEATLPFGSQYHPRKEK